MSTLVDNFAPEFVQAVVYSPDGRETPINPRYCASDKTANELVKIFEEQGIFATTFKQGPQGRLFGGWFSDGVNWFQFREPGPEGTQVNAGLLADPFAHGYPKDYALRWMLFEYKDNAWMQGFGEEARF